MVFYGSYGLHLLANALCAGCHECALGVVPQVHLAVPMHLVHLVQDLLDGGRLSCPLDVHCIRKPVCDCRNLDVAVALSAPLCSHSESESLGGGERKYINIKYIIITPWALLGEASRRRAQGCNSSYIEECTIILTTFMIMFVLYERDECRLVLIEKIKL